MKQKAAILGVILLLVTAGYFIFSKDEGGGPVVSPVKKILSGKAARSGLDPASLLPDNTVFYSRSTDMSSRLASLKDSRLGRAVQGIDLARLAEATGAPQKTVDEINRGLGYIKQGLEHPLFKEVFGKKYAVALLAPAEGVNLQELTLETFLTGHLMVISRPDDPKKVLTSLEEVFSGKAERKSYQHNGNEITFFADENEAGLYVCPLKELVLLTLSKKVMENSLDLHKSGQNNLAARQHFAKYQKEFAGSHSFTFLQIDQVKKIAAVLADKLSPEVGEQLKPELDKLDGYEYVAAGTSYEKDGKIVCRSSMGLNKEKMAPYLKAIYFTSPEKNQTVHNMAHGSLLYYWLNNLDLQAYYQMLIEEGDFEQKDIDELNREFEQEIGMNLPDLLAIFGKKLTFAIKKSKTQMFLPIPDLYLGMNLQDKAKFEQLIKKITSDNGVQVSTREYKGHTLNFFDELAQAGMKPGYVIKDDLLIIADNQQVMQEVIDSLDGAGNSDISPDYKQVSKDFDQKNNSITYCNLAGCLEFTKGLVDWAAAFATAGGNEDAKRLQVVLDELVYPLLDGFSMYTHFGSRAVVEGSELKGEAIILTRKEEK
ncbi:MAG: hypothetical protein CSB24_05460 [Deltaproteobacteria bacterium]|nr:MAG: hypothetical protein CSB24_05460 [Deltaproteobacteria bacterium]